jgi:hypothetical protein
MSDAISLAAECMAWAWARTFETTPSKLTLFGHAADGSTDRIVASGFETAGQVRASDALGHERHGPQRLRHRAVQPPT